MAFEIICKNCWPARNEHPYQKATEVQGGEWGGGERTVSGRGSIHGQGDITSGDRGVVGGGDCLEINMTHSFHKEEKIMEPILHKSTTLRYGKIITDAIFLTHSYVSSIRCQTLNTKAKFFDQKLSFHSEMKTRVRKTFSRYIVKSKMFCSMGSNLTDIVYFAPKALFYVNFCFERLAAILR